MLHVMLYQHYQQTTKPTEKRKTEKNTRVVFDTERDGLKNDIYGLWMMMREFLFHNNVAFYILCCLKY